MAVRTVCSLLFLSRRLSTGDSSALRVGEKKLGIKRGKEGQTNARAEEMSRNVAWKQFVASANHEDFSEKRDEECSLLLQI